MFKNFLKSMFFFVQMSVLFKLRQSAEIQSMMAGINKLQITSCLYAEEHRETSKALVRYCSLGLLDVYLRGSRKGFKNTFGQ